MAKKLSRVQFKAQMLRRTRAFLEERDGILVELPGGYQSAVYLLPIPLTAMRVTLSFYVNDRLQLPTIFTRLEDAKTASKFIACNDHSGKWNFHASDWSEVMNGYFLRTFMQEIDSLRMAMQTAIEDGAGSNPALDSLRVEVAAMEKLMLRYAKFGATDAEPVKVFQSTIFRELNGYASKDRFAPATWRLATDLRGVKAAALALGQQAEKCRQAVTAARRADYGQTRMYLVRYCRKVSNLGL